MSRTNLKQFHLARRNTILATTESKVVVLVSKCGLLAKGRVQTAKQKQRILPARGIHEVR